MTYISGPEKKLKFYSKYFRERSEESTIASTACYVIVIPQPLVQT